MSVCEPGLYAVCCLVLALYQHLIDRLYRAACANAQGRMGQRTPIWDEFKPDMAALVRIPADGLAWALQECARLKLHAKRKPAILGRGGRPVC